VSGPASSRRRRSRNPGLVLAAATCALLPGLAAPAPTTIFRAPSADAAPLGALRVGYDTAFWPGSGRSAAVPAALGLTAGVLPVERLRLEVGFDLVFPTRDPLVLNAKLGSPEGALFAGSPSLAVGIFEAGLTALTALDVCYAALGKRTRIGTFTVGGYVGSERLLRSSEGASQRAGLLAGVVFPAIPVGAPWLQRVELRWDLLTGKNPVGETGGGAAFFLTPYAWVTTGPVFFLDPWLQPGAARFLWSVRLEVEADLGATRRGDAAAGPR
jgi:hypothetical protein